MIFIEHFIGMSYKRTVLPWLSTTLAVADLTLLIDLESTDNNSVKSAKLNEIKCQNFDVVLIIIGQSDMQK